MESEPLVVEVWLNETSKPIVYFNVTSTYTKGPLFCIYQEGLKRVTKWPLGGIWRVIETYPDSDRRTAKPVERLCGTCDHARHVGPLAYACPEMAISDLEIRRQACELWKPRQSHGQA